MKKLLVALLLILTIPATAGVMTNYYTFTDFNLNPLAVVRVTQTPIQPFADYNGAILAPIPISFASSGSGTVYFTNTIAGYAYRVQIDAPPGSPTIRTCGYPSSLSGFVNGRDWLGNFGPGSVGGIPAMVFYYLNIAATNLLNSGSLPGQVLTATAGGIAWSNSTGGGGGTNWFNNTNVTLYSLTISTNPVDGSFAQLAGGIWQVSSNVYVASLTTTNGSTNQTLTASRVMVSGASKQEASLAAGPADGWFVGESNSTPIFTINAGAATNLNGTNLVGTITNNTTGNALTASYATQLGNTNTQGVLYGLISNAVDIVSITQVLTNLWAGGPFWSANSFAPTAWQYFQPPIGTNDSGGGIQLSTSNNLVFIKRNRVIVPAANSGISAGYAVAGAYTGDSGNETAGASFLFNLNSDRVALGFAGQGGWFKIMVNGNDPMYSIKIPSDGNNYTYQVLFANVAQRQVEVELDGSVNNALQGVYIPPTNSLAPFSSNKLLRFIIIGDSYSEEPIPNYSDTLGNPGVGDGYGARLGQLMPSLDVWSLGSGGTGYSNTDSGLRNNFTTRIQVDVVTNQPDYVLLAGGINDLTYPSNSIFSYATNVINQIRVGSPQTVIFAVGPFCPSASGGVPNASYTTIGACISNAMALFGIGSNYIDNLTEPQSSGATEAWITGTYNSAGSGNATRYISSDATHPTPDGHWYLAKRLASELSYRGVPTFSPSTSQGVASSQGVTTSTNGALTTVGVNLPLQQLSTNFISVADTNSAGQSIGNGMTATNDQRTLTLGGLVNVSIVNVTNNITNLVLTASEPVVTDGNKALASSADISAFALSKVSTNDQRVLTLRGPVNIGILNVTNNITNGVLTASELVGDDANKALISIAIGSGLTLSGGTLSTSGANGLPGTNQIIAYGSAPITNWSAEVPSEWYETNNLGNSVIVSNGQVTATRGFVATGGSPGILASNTMGANSDFSMLTTNAVAYGTNADIGMWWAIGTNGYIFQSNAVSGGYSLLSPTNFIYSNSIAYIQITNGHIFITNYTASGQSVDIDPSVAGTTLFSDNVRTSYWAIADNIGAYKSNSVGLVRFESDGGFFSNRLNNTTVQVTNGTVTTSAGVTVGNTLIVSTGGGNVVGVETNTAFTMATNTVGNVWTPTVDCTLDPQIIPTYTSNLTIAGIANLTLKTAWRFSTLITNNDSSSHQVILPTGTKIMCQPGINPVLSNLTCTNSKTLLLDWFLYPNLGQWVTNVKVTVQGN